MFYSTRQYYMKLILILTIALINVHLYSFDCDQNSVPHTSIVRKTSLGSTEFISHKARIHWRR